MSSKHWKKNIASSEFCTQWKYLSKMKVKYCFEGKDIQKLKEFITTQPTLQEMLQEVLQIDGEQQMTLSSKKWTAWEMVTMLIKTFFHYLNTFHCLKLLIRTSFKCLISQRIWRTKCSLCAVVFSSPTWFLSAGPGLPSFLPFLLSSCLLAYCVCAPCLLGLKNTHTYFDKGEIWLKGVSNKTLKRV